jgi:hypothetical protein
MADWDADGARLQANLRRVLASVVQWSTRRDRITSALIKRWHRETMAGLDVPDPKYVARFRGERGIERQRVFVGMREGTKPERVLVEASAFVARLQAVLSRLDRLIPVDTDLDRDRMQAVIELAAWVHSEWVRIHPFANGNGRTARILTNAVLLRYGLPPVLRLRPRPARPYGVAGAHGMGGDARPMEALILRLLQDYRP